MNLEIDQDVKAVAEFMQSNVAAARLVGVATAIGRLAPILWGRYSADDVHALALAQDQPIANANATLQSAAIGCGPVSMNAGDGSVAATGARALM